MTFPQHPPVIYIQRPPSNGTAVASMILGIVAIVIAPWALIPFFGLAVVAVAFIPVVLAVALGHNGLRTSKRLGGTGHGSAMAGLVMGYISLALCIIPVALLIVAIATTDFSGS